MAIRRRHYKFNGLLALTHYQKFKTLLSVNLYSRLFKMATYTMEKHDIFFGKLLSTVL